MTQAPPNPSPGAGPPEGTGSSELVDYVAAPRMRGLPLLALIVLAGLVPTSVYFHWKVPGVIEEFRASIATEKQRTPEQRLALWFQWNQPQIHNRLRQLRLSAEQPWFVAYGIGPAAESAPVDVVGIDFSDFPVEAVQLDGMQVRVVLEAPRSLGVHALVGSQAVNVPHYPQAALAPHPTERVISVIDYAMRHPDDFLEAFVEDNPGASFWIRVGDDLRLLAEPVTAPGEGLGPDPSPAEAGE